MTVHDAISKRKRLIGQLQLLPKPRFGGVFAFQPDENIARRRKLAGPTIVSHGNIIVFVGPVSVSATGQKSARLNA